METDKTELIQSEPNSVEEMSNVTKSAEIPQIDSMECKSLVSYQRITPIEFLNRIYQFVPDELCDKLYTYIWSRDNDNRNKRTNSFKISELNKMMGIAKQINVDSKNVSFSMGLIDHPLGTHERAKSSDIVAIPCLWCDIDVANEVHGQNQKLATDN